MDLSNVNSISKHVIKAICNTLIDSIWQGLILAIVTGIIVICTYKSLPAKRYGLLVITFTLFALVTIGNFILELNPMQNGEHKISFHNNLFNERWGPSQKQLSSLRSLIDTALTYFNKNVEIIFFIWLFIASIRLLQLTIGLYKLDDLQNNSVFPLELSWTERINKLAKKLGINQFISIAESGIATVPMVIGHLKPIILIPIGLLTALKTEEIEAILMHELAHIYRKDYLVNLLQSVMETLFFFNPALLWLSSLIRIERENCCDDIAIDQTKSKINYIRALVSCQEYQLQSTAYAMALYDNKSHLKTRVNRILFHGTRSLVTREKSMIAISLIIAAFFIAGFSEQNLQHQVIAANNHTNMAVNRLPTYNVLTKSFETYDYPKDKLRINDFISELIAKGVVGKKYKSISFNLSDKEFILNGKKQPKVLFEHIKRKYIIANNEHWSWRCDHFSPTYLKQLQENSKIIHSKDVWTWGMVNKVSGIMFTMNS